MITLPCKVLSFFQVRMIFPSFLAEIRHMGYSSGVRHGVLDNLFVIEALKMNPFRENGCPSEFRSANGSAVRRLSSSMTYW
jgi:hypothetical protein